MKTNYSENMIYGIWAVIETIRSGKDLEKVFIQKGVKSEQINELKQLIRDRNVPYSVVPPEKLNRFTRKAHQGVVAFVSPVQYFPLDQVISQTYEEGKQPLLLMLDGVTDVRNFGSIARTAECMGVHGIIIPTGGSAQINADAVKTSAGALNFIPVCREPNLELSVKYMKDSGIQVVAVTEKTDKVLADLTFTDPVCLVMGAEDVGVSPAVLNACHERAQIPMAGRISSLNVGSACSMALYEIAMQRSK
jgi:23S rRNA (guanosine2251-2'-O)-methyltransferase